MPTLIFTERLIALYNDVAFYSNCGHFLQFAEQLMQQHRATDKLQQSSRMSSSLKIRAAEEKKHLVSNVERVFYSRAEQIGFNRKIRNKQAGQAGKQVPLGHS